MSKSIIIDTNFNITITDLKEYADIKKAVDGRIEGIYMNGSYGFATGYVNEEGKLLNLPSNPLATLVYAKANGWDKFYDIIVGNAIFTGEVDKEGETTDVSDKMISLVEDAATYFVKLIAKKAKNKDLNFNFHEELQKFLEI